MPYNHVSRLVDFASRAITPRTKMIIVNTPHNPVGKVFTREELEGIAALAKEFNFIVLSDEVVGHLSVLADDTLIY